MENSVPTFSAVFKDAISAENAYNLAIQKGYKKEDINILMSEDTKSKNYGSRLQNSATSPSVASATHDAAEGAGVGGVIGTTAGALAAAIAAIGTNLVIPGLGLVIAGPIAAAFAGAGAGGIAGGVIGALVNAGLTESDATKYETALNEGGIVISIKPHSEEEAKLISNEWKAFGGSHFSS